MLEKYNGFIIVNTCTIVYFLVAFAFSTILNDNIIASTIDVSSAVLMKKLDRIIKSALTLKWNRAKSIWILEVLKLEPTRRKFCTFGDEFTSIIQHLNKLQLINFECCQKIFYHNDQLYFQYDEADKLVLSIHIERPCESCGSVNVTKTFSKSPLWLIIQNLITTYQKTIRKES